MMSNGLDCVTVTGNEISTQPKLSGSLTLQYTHDLSNGMEWLTRWNTRYVSSQYVSEMNLAELGAYAISDLRTGLASGDGRAELYVTNLFDEDTPQDSQYFFDGRILDPGGRPAQPPFAQNISYTDRRAQAYGVRFHRAFIFMFRQLTAMTNRPAAHRQTVPFFDASSRQAVHRKPHRCCRAYSSAC